MNIKKIKDIVKKVVDYHIEGDYHVYTVKNTPLSIRILMTRKYNKKWANLPVNPRKIIFDNYMGSGYGCNGKYITEELIRECSDTELYGQFGMLRSIDMNFRLKCGWWNIYLMRQCMSMLQRLYGFAIFIWCPTFTRDFARKKASFLSRHGMGH